MDHTPQPSSDQNPIPGHSHHDTRGEVCAYTTDQPRPRKTDSVSSHGHHRRRANRDGRTRTTTPYSPHRVPLMSSSPYPPRLSRAKSSHVPHGAASVYHHDDEHQDTSRTDYDRRCRSPSPEPASEGHERAAESGAPPAPGLYRSQWLPSPTLEPLVKPDQNTFLPLLEIEAPSQQRRLQPSHPEEESETFSSDRNLSPRK